MAGKKLDVVMVSTEMVPFSKVGGLADVVGALPDELEKLGCSLVVFTPLYSEVSREKFDIRAEKDVKPMKVTCRREAARIHPLFLPEAGTGIKVYFIDNEYYYGRKGIYTVPETGEAFKDEDERIIFFNRAVMESIKALKLSPGVIHCNDFHSGLLPVYLSIEESDNELLKNTGTVFSVHNLAYQGLFEPDFLGKAGLDPQLFQPMSPFEFWGRVNVMKMALMFSGLINTVSRSYAEEISESEEYGCGLEGVLKYRGKDLIGILNGIDPAAWDPATDKLIPAHGIRSTTFRGKR